HGQQCGCEGEGQCEDRVLELDHFEREAHTSPEAYRMDRGRPVACHSCLTGHLACLFHEVIPDHVTHDHVGVFDAPHMRSRHLNVELRHRTELPAVTPGESDRAAADGT